MFSTLVLKGPGGNTVVVGRVCAGVGCIRVGVGCVRVFVPFVRRTTLPTDRTRPVVVPVVRSFDRSSAGVNRGMKLRRDVFECD